MGSSDTVAGRFRDIVSEFPERVALIDGEMQYTYRDLASLSSAYAEIFRDSLDLSSGQILLAWLNNCADFAAGFLAAAEVGTVFFPLNVNLRPPELRWFLNRLPIAGVVTRQSLRAPWDALADHVSPARLIDVGDPQIRSRLLRTSGAGSLPTAARVSPDQPVVYLSSAGSTGVPKIVPRSHRNTVEGAAATASALGVTPGLRFLSIVPFYHGNGLDNSLSLPLLAGATVVLQSGFTPTRFADALTRHRIDALVGSPAIFELLARSAIDEGCLSNLTICASSGGQLVGEIVEVIGKRFGVTIRQVYGSSETGVIAVDHPEGGSSLVPVPGVTLRILDAAGRSLPPGGEGEIAVRGPAVVSGYVVSAEDAHEAFRDGFYRTGDSGRLDSGARLTFLGRIRPVINLSGTKVDPVEIENALLLLPAVSACRVSAALGRRHNQIIKAIIAVREGASLSRAEVIGHCRQLLAEYKIPRIVELVPALPPDLTGKRSVSHFS